MPRVGEIYYMVQYVDEALTRPVVSSFRYNGRTDSGTHYFSMLGLGDVNVFLEDSQVEEMLELAAMVKELTTPDLARTGLIHVPKRAP
jgi:hypothetical protein